MLAPIAAGGMGVVYRSRDTKLDRDVALKVLPDTVALNPVALKRFEAEAKAIAALSHPGIVAIHDFGCIGGTTFAVTELLDGETLRAALVRGSLPLSRALDVAAQVAEAVGAAHESGLVHRDLKPENIFLTRDGHAKVLDFGLAVRCGQLADGNAEAEIPTDPALGPDCRTPGTAAYMSPEHARGLAVGAPSDQFSLGVVLYEMLAGVRPFRGSSPAEILSAVLRDDPPPVTERVPDLPEPVRWIIERCLRKRPEDRYASTFDLAHDLRDCRTRLKEGSLLRNRPLGNLRPIWWAAAGIAGALLFLAIAAARWASSGRDPAEYRSFLSARHARRITDRGMNALTPALSPSGHEVAFVRRLSSSNTDVFVESSSGGRPINVTGDHPGEDGEPAFSPDGTHLAFRSDRDGGGIFLVEALGGTARRLTAFGHDPAFFPDGRRVVFATVASRTPYARLGTRSELWTVDLATGETVRLYGGDAMQPAVSPGGQRIAFWMLREGASQRDLATIPVEPELHPANPVLVTDDAWVDWSPYWSDDGRTLCFGSNRGGTMNLWRVRIDEKSGRPLAPPEPLTVPARSAGPFRGSLDGRAVVYQAGTSGFDLERLPLDARGLPAGPAVQLLVDHEGIGEPRLSPSGSHLAFATWRADEDLWVIGIDGRDLRRVTAGLFRDRSPSFSVDGRSLFFHSDRSGKFEIWNVLLDGSALRPITHREDLQPFRALASPDGRSLALQSTKSGTVILPATHPADAPWPDPLPPPEPDARFEVTSFSSDGRLVGGHGISREERYHGLWIFDLEKRRYERLPAEGACPQLARGGDRIYFLRQRQLFAPATVALLDRARGKVFDVLPQDSEPSVVAFAAARDGSALYLVRERSRSDIWLMR